MSEYRSTIYEARTNGEGIASKIAGSVAAVVAVGILLGAAYGCFKAFRNGEIGIGTLEKSLSSASVEAGKVERWR